MRHVIQPLLQLCESPGRLFKLFLDPLVHQPEMFVLPPELFYDFACMKPFFVVIHSDQSRVV